MNALDNNLFYGVQQGDIGFVADQLRRGANANIIAKSPNDNYWYTPLMTILEPHRDDRHRSAYEIVDLLIKHGADVNAAADASGAIPLCCAAQLGFDGIVRLLLNAGAKVDSVGSSGGTPLYLTLAAPGDDNSVKRTLIGAGANVNFVNKKEGYSILFMAANMGKVNFVNLLLDNGADMSWHTSDNLTALTQAVYRQHSKVVQALLEHGALKYDIDYAGNSRSLGLAIGKSDYIADLLESYGAKFSVGVSREQFGMGVNSLEQFLREERNRLNSSFGDR
jgi:ankyrin repeat protein